MAEFKWRKEKLTSIRHSPFEAEPFKVEDKTRTVALGNECLDAQIAEQLRDSDEQRAQVG